MAIQDFNVVSLDGSNGFRLDGSKTVFFLGRSVSSAGDVNGDGFADVIVGDNASYVLFGQASGFGAAFDLSTVDGSNGFRLNVQNQSVSQAGDINGDGFDDVIVGARWTNAYSQDVGASYVIFGKASGFDAQVDLSALNGSNGFRLNEVDARSYSGFSVSGAGDINGDGFADLIIGDPKAGERSEQSGSSFVVFGQAAGFDAQLDLSSLNGSNGFRLDGVALYDDSGFSVSNAGDVNGDGFDDVIVGSPNADFNGDQSGSSYVIFGKASGFDAQFDLSSLNGSNGFRLDGEQASDYLGQSVSSAGDVNGDGFADVIVGAHWTDPNGQFSGSSYVVFGKAAGFDASLQLSSLDGSNGFRLDGEDAFEHAGASVSSAGDVNGDGVDDLIVGAFWADTYTDMSGASYVVYGRKSGFDARIDLSSIDGRNGFRVNGEVFAGALGQSVSGAGDVNHDGFDDLIVGAEEDSYVIFGSPDVAGSSALILIEGTDAADPLQGTGAAEYLDAGVGNDVLAGGGGADKLDGGEGDDVIGIDDLDFAAIDGGAGVDTLQLQGTDLQLDLTQLADQIHHIETFDLQGGGDSTLTVTADSLSQVQGSFFADATTIRGDSGDRVVLLDRNWNDGGIAEGYHTYFHQNGSQLRVQEQVSVELVASEFDIHVSELDGRNGFRLDGANAVSDAGDVNGDGFGDVIIGDSYAGQNGDYSGSSYVVFGRASGFDAQMDLSSLDGHNGFRLDGEHASDFSGKAVSGAGDVNGDGFDDVIVGAWGADTNGDRSGSSYVIFGKASGFDASMNLSSLDGHNGFRLDGTNVYDFSGQSVNSAGDVNGDGFGDVIVETSGVSSYVVFGKADGFDAHLDLSALDGSNGFRFDREGGHNRGYLVSSAGDVNDDGFDDVIIGDPNDDSYAGSSYVVFGKASGFAARIDVSSLDGRNGFRMKGVDIDDGTGLSVSSAGDVNGDGFGDVIVGTVGADSDYGALGASYVVFGKASGFDAEMDLSALDGRNGFRLDGEKSFTNFGHSVSGAGDINGDGFDDLIMGTSTRSSYGSFYLPTPSYVIFGKATGFDARLSMDELKGDTGFRIDNGTQKDLLGSTVSSAGDVNGDGLDDLILGALVSNSSYIIFGSRDFGHGGGGGELPEIKGTGGDDTLKGSEAAEHFIAGGGNDNLLGLGGADVFDAGAGDDAIRIGDLTFASIDGGEGNDALHLVDSGMNLDLSVLGDQIHNIETICLYGRGDNTLTLTAETLLSLSESTNTLKVHGNTGDHIVVQDSDWVDGGSQGFYHSYTHDGAVLLVGANVVVEFV